MNCLYTVNIQLDVTVVFSEDYYGSVLFYAEVLGASVRVETKRHSAGTTQKVGIHKQS